MPMIRVRAKSGRVVRDAPSGGDLITTDEGGQLVRETPWIIRLLNVHRDLVRVKVKDRAAPAKAVTDEPAN